MDRRDQACGNCDWFLRLRRAVITPPDIDGGECTLHTRMTDELHHCEDWKEGSP